MYCPNCRDEFRAGFTHCAACNVDLVEQLGAEPPESAKNVAASATAAAAARPRMIDFCGFFELEEARRARDDARGHSIRAEIAIREAPDSSLEQPIEEEYWLRVEADRFRQASDLLGFESDDPETSEETAEQGTFRCGSCSTEVREDATICSNCGARFE